MTKKTNTTKVYSVKYGEPGVSPNSTWTEATSSADAIKRVRAICERQEEMEGRKLSSSLVFTAKLNPNLEEMLKGLGARW